jgi:hypothetical protein
MSTTNILTLDQGIILMIETCLFLIFYYIYHFFFGRNMAFTSVFLTTLIFAMWILSITVFSNIALALNVQIKSSSSIPFRDNGMNWKTY